MSVNKRLQLGEALWILWVEGCEEMKLGQWMPGDDAETNLSMGEAIMASSGVRERDRLGNHT